MENVNDDTLPTPVQDSKSKLGVWKTILIGWFWVNIPALILMIGIVAVGIKVVQTAWWLFLLVGLVIGWTWWSFMIPRWRRWAHQSGVSPDKLQKAAVATGLTWPKGSLLEKTEFKIDK